MDVNADLDAASVTIVLGRVGVPGEKDPTEGTPVKSTKTRPWLNSKSRKVAAVAFLLIVIGAAVGGAIGSSSSSSSQASASSPEPTTTTPTPTTPTPTTPTPNTSAPTPSSTPTYSSNATVSTILYVAASDTVSALTGIAVGRSGSIYVSDQFRVFEFALGATSPTVYAGSSTYGSVDGTATNARFASIRGLGIDSSGVIYVADGAVERVRKISTSRGVTTIAGGGISSTPSGSPATSVDVGNPYAVAVDKSSNVYIADWYNNRVIKLDAASSNAIFFPIEINSPRAIAVTQNGTVYVAHISTIYQLSSDGVISFELAVGFSSIAGLALSTTEEDLFIVDRSIHCIRRLNLKTREISTAAGLCYTSGSDDGIGELARFDEPTDITSDTFGALYVVDGKFSNPRIRKIIV